jgi:hypothetical protein
MTANAGPALRTYLDDHLAGAASGIRLARKLERRNRGTVEHAAFARLVADVEADQAALMKLRAYVGMPKRTPKELVGIAVEYASRLKSTIASRRDAGAGRLLELEALGIGIQGKRAMWRALHEAFADDELDAVDLTELVRRADSQHRFVETHRLATAKQSLAARRLRSIGSPQRDEPPSGVDALPRGGRG